MNLAILLTVLLYKFIFIGPLLARNSTCPTGEKKSEFLTTSEEPGFFYFNYEGYDGFAQLNPKCDLIRELNKSAPDVFATDFKFLPKIPIMTANVDVTGSHGFGTCLLNTVTLNRLSGLLTSPTPLVLFDQSAMGSILILQNVKFQLFNSVSDANPVDNEKCVSLIRQLKAENETNSTQEGIFSQADNVIFGQSNQFSSDACPILFKNCNLKWLEIFEAKEDYFLKNNLGFAQYRDAEINDILDRYLNSNINLVIFRYVYRIVLSHRNLDQYVFKYTKSIDLSGSLNGIEAETFKNLENLRSLRIHLFNMQNFFHSSDNRWLIFLNYNSSHRTKKSLFSLLLTDANQVYDYPDEDICLFRYLTRKLAVVPMVTLASIAKDKDSNENTTQKLLKMTCTLSYFYEIYTYYKRSNLSRQATWYNLTINTSYIPNCDLDAMFEKCNTTPFIVKQNALTLNEWGYYDITYLFEWLEFVGPILTLPVVCFFGFVTNLVIIIVLTKKEYKKDFEERMYDYMRMNSIFNCIECFILIFLLMSECIKVNSSVYCSKIQQIVWVQYFRIYVVGYGGEVMKTCSILTSLAFSLERYIVTSNTKNPWLVKFSKISIRKFNLLVIIFSLLTSIVKLYDFKISMTGISATLQYYPISSYLTSEENKSLQALKVIFFAHYVLNDLVFWLVNGFIDFCLILVIKSNLRTKHKVIHRINDQKLAEDLKHHHSKVNDKINKIIIFNLGVYSICRFPELFYLVLTYYFDFRGTIFESNCYSLKICYLFSDLIEYLYIFSFTINIYFYYKFNSSFSKNLRKLLGLPKLKR